MRRHRDMGHEGREDMGGHGGMRGQDVGTWGDAGGRRDMGTWDVVGHGEMRGHGEIRRDEGTWDAVGRGDVEG